MLSSKDKEEIKNEIYPLERLTSEQRCIVTAVITCFAQANALKVASNKAS